MWYGGLGISKKGGVAVLTEPFVLLDTEFTAEEDSKKRNWEGEYREIIQIGAIGVSRNLTAMWQYDVFIRPHYKPQLSAFIQKLTGITQSHVDSGLRLPAALEPLKSLTKDMPIYCYGTDGEVIQENFSLLGYPMPIPVHSFVNLKYVLRPLLIELGVNPDAFSSGELIGAFGKEGKRAHNALSDVQNLLVVLQELRMQNRL